MTQKESEAVNEIIIQMKREKNLTHALFIFIIAVHWLIVGLVWFS